ncbi:MAG: hypothetical protein ABL879_04145 [Devosia sp.]
MAAGLLIYLAAGLIVFFDWVPTPLNRNIEGMSSAERLPSTLIHGGIGIVLGTACLLGFWPAYWVAAIWYAVVFIAAVRNWWIPYFTGRPGGEISLEDYDKHYAGNPRFFSRGAGQIVPDVQHTLIHLALLAACLSALYAAL